VLINFDSISFLFRGEYTRPAPLANPFVAFFRLCLIEWIQLRPLPVDYFALTGAPIPLITPVMDDRKFNVFTQEIRGLRAAGAKVKRVKPYFCPIRLTGRGVFGGIGPCRAS
jgi:hypothetical protein